MVCKNFLNSIARWRACSERMTLPLAMFSAANRLLVPWRLYYRGWQIGPENGMMAGWLMGMPGRCRRTLRRHFGCVA